MSQPEQKEEQPYNPPTEPGMRGGKMSGRSNSYRSDAARKVQWSYGITPQSSGQDSDGPDAQERS